MSTVLEYKCPCCDGALEFDSASQKMKCPYCENEYNMETLREYDDNLKAESNEELEWDTSAQSEKPQWDESEASNMVTYVCESCAGEIVVDQYTSATSCPYCGNNVVIKQHFTDMHKPDFVLPFKLSKDDAKKALSKHIKGKKLLPNFFKEENHIDSVTGVYVPFWLFDCETESKITYDATRIHTWSDSNYNYTKTDYYMLTRAGNIEFEKVPVDGSTKMDDIYMESIEPFNYSDLVDFQSAYLAGYVSETHDVSAENSTSRANERIKQSTISMFNSTTGGYATCTPNTKNIDLKQGSIGYALLPVWILNTKYKGKLYTFAMNGQTGKFVGELPVDSGKFWKYFFGIFAGFSVVGSVIATFFL